MSATDELRRMLDDHDDGSERLDGQDGGEMSEKHLPIMGGGYDRIVCDLDGTAWVRERTCKCTTDDSAWCFECSECGKTFPRDQLHLAYNHGEINYCPNCGAKVVDE